jgi:poly(ADP-ribose) glycohydrolase ARH3
MNKSIVKSKFIGALIGTAIGDALGMPYELNTTCTMPLEMREGRLPKGSYTDDTELMIGVAESLITNEGLIDQRHMLQRFIENFDRKRGYGFGTTQILHQVAQGGSFEVIAKTMFGEGSFGNGAAMHIAPVSLVYYDTSAKLYDAVVKSSEITHAHTLGIDGALLQAHAIAIALRSNPTVTPLDKTEFIAELYGIVKHDLYKQKLDKISGFLDENGDYQLIIDELGNTVEAYNSVPVAIYSFLKNSQDFEDAVTYAVCLGGDTDTIGAMTGAISGAYLGVEAIPERWLNCLENKDYILKLAERLFSLKYDENKRGSPGWDLNPRFARRVSYPTFQQLTRLPLYRLSYRGIY